MDREKQIVRASVISIVGNVILAITKGAVGVVTGSIAIALDAINSLTDALASVIAVIGARLAGKAANRSHPFGYGRMEYLSSIVIAALILSAGISSFTESVRSIMHPTDPQYSVVSLIICYGWGNALTRDRLWVREPIRSWMEASLRRRLLPAYCSLLPAYGLSRGLLQAYPYSSQEAASCCS